MKKNAIFMASSNQMSFASANALMSIVDNSSSILSETDFFVLTDDMSETNRQVLKKIIPDIKFVPLFRNLPQEILQDDKAFRTRWGIYVLQVLYGFELINQYEQALCLEADMFVMSDISELFRLDCDIAWRNLISWDPRRLLKGVLRNPDDKVVAPNGGLVLFRNSINRYHIDQKSFSEAYQYFKSVKEFESHPMGEKILCYLCYVREMKLKMLDWAYNNGSFDFSIANGKIVHFNTPALRPWSNELIGSLMPEWFINHRKFLSYGGVCEEKVHIPTISRKKIYDAVERGGWAINLIPQLSFIKNKCVQIQYAHGNPFIKFLINDWPTSIYYVILLRVTNVTIALRVEGTFRDSPATIKCFQMMESLLKNLLPQYTLLTHPKLLSLEIAWNKNDVPMINFLMNELFDKTYPKINAVLCGSTTDVLGDA